MNASFFSIFLLNFCAQNNIITVGYRVIFQPPNDPRNSIKESPVNDEIVKEIANKYGKTPHQVLIKWNLQRNSGVMVKSVNPSRILENWKAGEFVIEEEDMARLNSIDKQVEYADTVRLFGLKIE